MNNTPFNFGPADQQHQNPAKEDFEELEATELYCPKCSRAVPVRKFLLLILPDGDRYEYRCQFCGTKVGNKTNHSGQFHTILRG